MSESGSINRRQCMSRVMGAASALVAWPTASIVSPSSILGVEPNGLADQLRKAERNHALEIAARALRKNATPQDVLAAVLAIGVEEIRPRPHGILHTVMMVHSSLALSQGASGKEAAMLALWNLDDLKAAQIEDRDEWSDWKMPPNPKPDGVETAKARAEFVDAMNAWDADRADHAVVALFPKIERSTFFELLWPFAARCSTFIGHKMIYAVNLERATQVLPWTMSMARSVVRTLLVERDTDLWSANLKPAQKLQSQLTARPSDSAAALTLYQSLRRADSKAAMQAVIDFLNDNGSITDAWHALRFVASEIFHARSGRRSNTRRNALLPVHAVTVVNAFAYVAGKTSDALLAARCLLEITGRLPLMRNWLIESTGLNRDSSSLEVLLNSDQLKMPTQNPRAYLRTSLLRTAIEHHQHKYAAAIFEDAAAVPSTMQALILKPAFEYLAHPDDPSSELYRRMAAALA